tara:strand:- start:228 stop:419 length:192 start_codon:yes stop_codon:yes gene_type:complete
MKKNRNTGLKKIPGDRGSGETVILLLRTQEVTKYMIVGSKTTGHHTRLARTNPITRKPDYEEA